MSIKTRTYKIAEHYINITMEDPSSIWNYMKNYTPFVYDTYVKDATCDIKVISQESINLNEYTHIYSNNNDKNIDIVGFNIYKNSSNDYLIGIECTPDNTINAWLFIDSTFSNATIQLHGTDKVKAFAMNRAIMLSFLLSTANKDTLLMHSSVIKIHGKGYLFMGKSGTGKSTHSSLWRKYYPESELMNDDNPIVRVIKNEAIVYGSPWSGKTPCYRNISAPIGGFIRLKQAKENIIRRLNIIESYASLTTSASGLPWEKITSDGKHHILQYLSMNVPCWILECRPDEEAARVCYTTVTNE